MTTVVLTPATIYADRRISLSMSVKDWMGNEVELNAQSDAFCKITFTDLKDEYGEHIKACAVFGSVDTARAIYELAELVGLMELPRLFRTLAKLNPVLTDVPSGFAWVDSRGGLHGAYVTQHEHQVVSHAGDVLCFGSGKAHFDAGMLLFQGNVDKAFWYALHHDDQSSTGQYDKWSRDTGTLATALGVPPLALFHQPAE